ncbi:MAG: hypothetical protein V2A55_01210 [Candidatus Jorgensenbacteria bacterium]
MTSIGFFSLAVLVAALVFQVATYKTNKSNGSYKSYRALFWFLVASIVLFYFYLVYSLYLAWSSGGGIGKFLVPPYGGISYVFGYQFSRFLLHYLVALAVAFALLVSAKRLNRRFGERFFESQEPYLGAISVLLLGQSVWDYAWIYYLIAILALAVVGSLVVSHWLKRKERFSLYWLWLPVAILVILIKTAL